jgi:hypothetical protein
MRSAGDDENAIAVGHGTIVPLEMMKMQRRILPLLLRYAQAPRQDYSA